MTTSQSMATGPSATVAKRLHDARIAQSKSIDVLSEATGIARETLRRKVDKGAGDITMGELRALTKALGLDAAELVREAVAA